MNNNNYLETLNQLFSDSVPSKDKVLGLMDDTMTFFRRIKTKLESNDPADPRDKDAGDGRKNRARYGTTRRVSGKYE
jgi:hypothetical protein